jgi:Sec-independent protein translocase protein TatA
METYELNDMYAFYFNQSNKSPRSNLPPTILSQLKLVEEYKNQISQLQEQVKLIKENKDKEKEEFEKQVANLTKENNQLKSPLQQNKYMCTVI